MLRNNNQPVIRRLYKRFLERNKLRNIITIIAIVLTTFMFTAVFTMGYSVVGNLNQMLLRGQGSKSSVYLDMPTDKQTEAARSCSTVDAAGLRIRAASAKVPGGEDSFGIYYYDEVEFNKNLLPALGDVYGSCPVRENEIMLPLHMLEKLGIKSPAIGNEVSLCIDDSNETFILSGWYVGFSARNPVLISEAYASFRGRTAENAGTLSVSAKNGNVADTLKQLEEKVVLNSGQKWRHTFDVQTENKSNRLIMVASMCLLSLLIVTGGYLLVYNVMYISVAKDIRFFGMLKTIGASSSQIKKLVKLQARYLAVIGVPVGMLLGSLASFGLVPLSMLLVGNGRDGMLSEKIHFNPYIYLFAIAFSAITVYISANKPAKFAGKVSPVEALRYYEGQNEKIRSYKKSGSNKVFSMAFRNVFRDRKRCRLVFTSLFLGCMMFLCVNTFIHALDADSFLQHYFYNDYVLYIDDVASPEQTQEESVEDMGASFGAVALQIKQLDGIEYIYVNRYAHAELPFDENVYRPFIENGAGDEEGNTAKDMAEYFKNNTDSASAYSAPVIAVDTKMLEIYNRTARQKIDLERFEKGEICLIGFVKTEEQADYLLGRTITVANPDTGKQKSIEIGSAPIHGDDEGITAGYYWVIVGAPEVILVSDSFMDEMFPDAEANTIIANAEKDREPEVTEEIQRIVKENKCIGGADIRTVGAADFKRSMMSLTIVGDGLSMILVLIGLINFVNVMLTSVYTRSRELAILESVGMTKKQIKKMLISEGMIYAAVTVALIWTAGSGMMYGVGALAKRLADYAVMNYPFAAVLLLTALIGGICFIVPVFIFREISGQTVTERLRQGMV